ncbi:CinA family protein [Candidatus Formimonas warabiya]|uniref:CinA C-terminal domain-containing protein n=1 Tax=Formimonas warabiya TaxID=1761012 RepID=A0A3G1KP48_FORW1|nr:CinA family protein [Candidatus Formimonas warabiya]ATW24227.1 hypothetical protein DCMF_04990 [Candidatus Formimonas warabiya]
MKNALVIEQLKKNSFTISVAESCTGGLLSAALTSIPGSSECFGYGAITYSNQAKHETLGVPWEILQEFGAVSYQTAFWMAKCVRKIAQSHLGVSITGIAGPAGGSERKPVGLVFMALAKEGFCVAQKYYFQGDREEIRRLTVSRALDLIIQYGVVNDENFYRT